MLVPGMAGIAFVWESGLRLLQWNGNSVSQRWRENKIRIRKISDAGLWKCGKWKKIYCRNEADTSRAGKGYLLSSLSLSLSLSLCKIMKSVKRLFRMGNRCGCIQWVSILFKLWFNVLPALKGQNIVCESTKIFYSCLFWLSKPSSMAVRFSATSCIISSRSLGCPM